MLDMPEVSSCTSQVSLPWDQHTVSPIPTISYVPDYISTAEEMRLLSEVHACKTKWVELSGRRLQSHGGIVHEKGLIPAPIPAWLRSLIKRLHGQTASMGLYGQGPPNHVLINSYRPGEGIMVSGGRHVMGLSPMRDSLTESPQESTARTSPYPPDEYSHVTVTKLPCLEPTDL